MSGGGRKEKLCTQKPWTHLEPDKIKTNPTRNPTFILTRPGKLEENLMIFTWKKPLKFLTGTSPEPDLVPGFINRLIVDFSWETWIWRRNRNNNITRRGRSRRPVAALMNIYSMGCSTVQCFIFSCCQGPTWPRASGPSANHSEPLLLQMSTKSFGFVILQIEADFLRYILTFSMFYKQRLWDWSMIEKN